MKLTNYLVNEMKRNKIITKDEDVYLYGLNSFFTLVINLITAVTISYIMHKPDILFFFFITFIPLRTYSGGFHFSSRLVCYIYSNTIIAIVLLLSDINSIALTSVIFFSVLSFCYLFMNRTVGTHIRQLDNKEIQHYTKKKRNFLVLTALLIIAFLLIHSIKYAITCMLSIIIVCTLVVIQKFRYLNFP